MKKVLSVLIAIILCLSVIPMTVAADSNGTCGENLTWTLTGGTLTISGTGDMYDYDGVYNCPGWQNDSLQVETITVTDGVTSIGEYAFAYCTQCTTLTIADSVTSIGERAFQNCNSLTAVDIPASVLSIGAYAFNSCGELTTINIPNSVTSMGQGAFKWCSKLTEIKIPYGITEIPQHCFEDCSSLTTIIIPETLKTVSYSAFYISMGSYSKLQDVYYQGSDKSAISIAEDNDAFKDATWHLNAVEYYYLRITDNGSLSVKYSVSPSYTVTIPSEVNLRENVTGSAENVVLEKGKTLTVAITETSDTNNEFKLKTTEGAELSYTVTVGDTPVSVGAPFLTVNPESSVSGSATLSFVAPTSTPQFAGEYEGTVTFGISIQ